MYLEACLKAIARWPNLHRMTIKLFNLLESNEWEDIKLCISVLVCSIKVVSLILCMQFEGRHSNPIDSVS